MGSCGGSGGPGGGSGSPNRGSVVVSVFLESLDVSSSKSDFGKQSSWLTKFPDQPFQEVYRRQGSGSRQECR